MNLCNNCHKRPKTDEGNWCQECMETVDRFCVCCKKNKVDTKKGQTDFCDNCWNYLMGNPMGLEWMDIWMLVCHWHAIHDKSDKDYDSAHDCILTAYSEKHGYNQNAICDGTDGIRYNGHLVYDQSSVLICIRCKKTFKEIQ